MKTLTVSATLEELATVQEFVETELEENECSMKVIMQVSINIEEIYVNIAKYAYPQELGNATINMEISGEPKTMTIEFIDSGIPFNPLAKKDADITLSADERDVGGLGILMVKKCMDEVDYVYENGQNIFTVKKILA